MRLIAGLALILLSYCVPVRGDDLIVHRVGDLGDVTRLEFRGVEELPIDEVREALSGSFEYQFAAHPSGPRHQLLSCLQQLMEQGYRRSGFPLVNVTFSRWWDREHLLHRRRSGDKYGYRHCPAGC